MTYKQYNYQHIPYYNQQAFESDNRRCFDKLVLVLLLSMGIGLVEARRKKEHLKKTSSIAIAPGYAVVIIGIMIGGFIS